MTWINPLWRAEAITDDKLNTRLRDNMITLKNPAHADVFGTSDPYAGAGGWALVGADLELTLDTLGGDVLLVFRAKANNCVLSFFVDGSNVGGNDGICAFPNIGGAGGGMTGSMMWLVRDLNEGTHTFGVYWKDGNLISTATAYFAAREIS
jgi:hypothetical protein